MTQDKIIIKISAKTTKSKDKDFVKEFADYFVSEEFMRYANPQDIK